MSGKNNDAPPSYYAGQPEAPKPTYNNQQYPPQGGYYPPQGQYYQQQPAMGYGQQPPGPYPQGPYPQQGGYYQQGPYGQPNGRYQDGRAGGSGLMEGLLAALCCCCCLDILI